MRSSYLAGGVGFNVLAELEVDVEAFGHAGFQHAEPGRRRFFQLGGGEEITGLDDDLECVGEIVGQAANLEGEVFRDDLGEDWATGADKLFGMRGHGFTGLVRGP